MAYVKQTWESNELISADKLNHMEEGIDGKKDIQSAVSSPSAIGTAVAFIDSISQNAQGVITATKKNVATVNKLTETTTGKVLDATQGKILNDKIDNLTAIGDIVSVSNYISFKNATVNFNNKEFSYRVVSPNHVVAYFLLRGTITEAKGDDGTSNTAYAVIDISQVPFPNRNRIDHYWSSIYLRESYGATVDQIESASIQHQTTPNMPDYIVFSKSGGINATLWQTNTTFYLRGIIDFYYRVM